MQPDKKMEAKICQGDECDCEHGHILKEGCKCKPPCGSWLEHWKKDAQENELKILKCAKSECSEKTVIGVGVHINSIQMQCMPAFTDRKSTDGNPIDDTKEINGETLWIIPLCKECKEHAGSEYFEIEIFTPCQISPV